MNKSKHHKNAVLAISAIVVIAIATWVIVKLHNDKIAAALAKSNSVKPPAAATATTAPPAVVKDPSLWDYLWDYGAL